MVNLEGYAGNEDIIEPRSERQEENQETGLWSRLKKALRYTALVGSLTAAGLVGAWYYNTDYSERVEHCRQARAVASQLYEKAGKTSRRGTNPLDNYLGSAIDGKYDNHNLFCDDSLEKLLDPIFAITSYTEYETVDYHYNAAGEAREVVKKRKYHGLGTGIVVHNNGERLKILTCEHVVSPIKEKAVYADNKLISEVRNVKSTHRLRFFTREVPLVIPPFFGVMKCNFSIDLELAASDKTKDLALLETKLQSHSLIRGIKPPTEWGCSSELKPGDFLYIAGFPYGLPKHLGDGRAASEPSSNISIYADANPGNSGGPVYALRDGKPELVGIMRAIRPQGLTEMVSIDSVKRFLDKAGLSFIHKGGKK